MNGATPPRGKTWPVWRWPVAMALLSGIGLVSGLFSDGGLGDAVAGLCLGVPVAVALWFGWLRR